MNYGFSFKLSRRLSSVECIFDVGANIGAKILVILRGSGAPRDLGCEYTRSLKSCPHLNDLHRCVEKFITSLDHDESLTAFNVREKRKYV